MRWNFCPFERTKCGSGLRSVWKIHPKFFVSFGCRVKVQNISSARLGASPIDFLHWSEGSFLALRIGNSQWNLLGRLSAIKYPPGFISKILPPLFPPWSDLTKLLISSLSFWSPFFHQIFLPISIKYYSAICNQLLITDTQNFAYCFIFDWKAFWKDLVYNLLWL